MSREIKFRAWQDNIMLTQPISSVYGTYRFFGLIHEDNANIMQFTGLKDKNGKEIYDGDVVEYGDIMSDGFALDRTCRIKGQVNWYEGRSQFVIQGLEENHRGGHYMCQWDYALNLEVIGNIYEHKHLLENN